MTPIKITPKMKKPLKPVPHGQRDPFGKPYKVRDYETWGSIARDHDISVDTLIWYNFDTHDTDEVNWYLHKYVGCNQPSHDGYNWKFSSQDKPGIIYLYPKPVLVGQDILQLPSNTNLARALDGAEATNRIIEPLHIALDVAEFTHIGLAIAEVEMLGLGGAFVEVVAPPVLGLALLGMALGMGDMEAIDEIKTAKARSGIAHGIVLGVAGESWGFIKTYFVDLSTDHNVNYPEQRRNFRGFYLSGLEKGIAYGRKLNNDERLRFFRHLDSRAHWHPPGNFYLTRRGRSDYVRKEYYSDIAATFLGEIEFDE